MKKRNMFITLGLALGLGIGVAAGVGARREERIAKAAGITSVALRGSFDGWSAGGVAFTKNGSGDYTLSYALTLGDSFGISVKGESDQFVKYSWGISGDNIDSEFVGEADSDNNFKALTNYTLNFKVKSTFYSNWGADVTIQCGETRTVQFVDSTNTVIAGTDNLIEEGGQFSGILTTDADAATIRIKDTVASTSRYYGLLEDGVTLATASDNLITITNEGTYAIYYKKGSHKCWVSNAEASQIAYVFAAFFNGNVGCDPAGLATPTGWSTCATKYGKLSDEVKNFIYAADTHWTSGDDLYNMIQTYNWALTHNPNRASMAHFIVNASGTERAVASAEVLLPISNNFNNNATLIIVVISSLVLLSVGGFFLLRKKREN